MTTDQQHNPGRTRRRLFTGVAAAGLLLIAGQAWAKEAPALPAAAGPDYAFDEGSSALLGSSKRVVISDFVVVFQLDSMVRNDNATKVGNLTLFGGNTKDVAAKMAWQAPDTTLMQDIADAGLASLKADFKAKGLEVLDESTLSTQPAYASILAAAGLKNLEDYNIVNISEAAYNKNSIGDDVYAAARVVSARGLTPYSHSLFEGGRCCNVIKGFPSSKIYYVPGFEIDLAKALDAVVVKAWLYVDFAKVSAGVNQEGWAGGVGGAVVNYSASADSTVRIVAQKTRLSFRLPTSVNKTRNVPKSWAAKDGDLVVALKKPMLIGDQYYTVTNAGETGGQKLRASLGGTQHLNFGATLRDTAAYKADLTKGMDKVLSEAVTTALGR